MDEVINNLTIHGQDVLIDSVRDYLKLTNVVITEDKTTSIKVTFTTVNDTGKNFVYLLINRFPSVGYKLHFSCEKKGYEGAYYFRDGRTRRNRTWRFGGDPDADRY